LNEPDRGRLAGKFMILIVSSPTDVAAVAVERILRRRGADVLLFDTGRFPSEAHLTVSYREGVPRYAIRTGDHERRFDELTSIWFRRPTPVSAHPSITDDEVRAVVEQDCNEFLESIWDGMTCPMLPGTPSTMKSAQRKAAHMSRAKALGFEVAPTSFTNDPRELLDLYRDQDGRLIHKINSMLVLRARRGTDFKRLTTPVSRRDIAHAESVSLSPIIFQAYVAKQLEVRVTVVGDRVFAAEIHSQQSNRSKIDWRRYDLDATPYFSHELPDELAERCVKLVSESGLTYGTIDLILTPDDRYVFLELNSAGEYCWIEQMTGLPISTAIADFLIAPMHPSAHVAKSVSEPLHA
jgi:hypothetical protein